MSPDVSRETCPNPWHESAPARESIKCPECPGAAVVVVKEGDEGLNGPALAYVESLGIPRFHIASMTIDSPVGGVQTITVKLFVFAHSEKAPTA